MKIRDLFYLICFSLMCSGFANAASYDIKENVAQTALVADYASVTADKVMDGVADVTLTLQNKATNTTQRVMLQCDTTQQTITSFYFMKDVLGGKAKGATGFLINAYNNAAEGYKHHGDVSVFDSTKDNYNLRKSFDLLSKLDGAGFISFEFFETNGGVEQNTIAHSMLLPSSYLPKILEAMDKYPDADGCRINGGAVSVYPLKNLTDSF